MTHDRYEDGLVAGGCAFYGARTHAALDGPAPHLLAVVGEDFECEDAIADLSRDVRRSGETTLFTNYYPEDAPRIQLIETEAPEVTPSQFSEELEAFFAADGEKLVHLAPVMGEVDLEKWLAVIPDDVRVGINVQGWIKEAGPRLDAADARRARRRGVDVLARRVVQKPWRVSPAQLDGVDIACMSTEDLLDQGDLLARFREVVPIVAVTNGEHGSTIFVGDDCWEIGAFDTEPNDPTGAGDVYTATLMNRILCGEAPHHAARYASAAASIAIEGQGPAALSRLDKATARRQAVISKQIV
ncbi:MAG: PfkB family carbohydrate kinase [Myxococcota bacterium]